MDDETELLTFVDYFNDIKDFRDQTRILYPLPEVLLLIFCAQLAGFESLRDYELFYKSKTDFLKRFYPYKNGCPSIATMLRILGTCNPVFFEKLIQDIAANRKNSKTETSTVYAIDGKSHAGVVDQYGKYLHTVSVYSTKERLIIGQQATEEKGGEIAVARVLCKNLNIENQIITGDAAFCYEVIINDIITAKADYIFQVKMNQPKLMDFIIEHVKNNAPEVHVNEDRYRQRKVAVINISTGPKELEQWPHVKSIVHMTSYNKRKNTEESRYFISSLTTSAVKMAGYIKSHWGIENDLHWYLDVVFKEDARIIWNKNFAKNEGIVRRLALHSVKKIQSLAAIKLNLKHVAAKNLRKILMGDDELFERAINDAFN